MNQVQANRLAAMVQILPRVPEENFYMGWWRGGEEPRLTKADRVAKNCGTSACLGGWTVAAFPDEWRWMSWDAPRLRRNSSGWPKDDFMKFYGITEAEASPLFFGPQVTPKEKAAECRAVLEKYGWTV